MRWTLLLICLLLVGCQGLMPPRIVGNKNSRFWITEGRGKLLVYTYDRESNSMIEFGWLDASQMVGWTLGPFDWDAYMQKQANK